MLLAAGGAAGEVRAQARNRPVGVETRELELDVAVELVEAGVAANLGAGRTEQPVEQLPRIVSLHQCSSRSSSAKPRSAR